MRQTQPSRKMAQHHGQDANVVWHIGRCGLAEDRVKAGFWVQMALRMGQSDGRYGMVLKKGDPDAGGILVMLRGRDGVSVLSQMRAADGTQAWMRGTGPANVDQETADAYVARQEKFDPDLWVLEFESPDMLPPFEAKIV